jgi:hypothetical protein
MSKIGAGFAQRGNAVMLRRWTQPQSPKLGKDEPHPVALLRSSVEFGKGSLIEASLGIDEALEIIGIGHAGIMGPGSPAEKSGSRLLVRREQPCQDIE